MYSPSSSCFQYVASGLFNFWKSFVYLVLWKSVSKWKTAVSTLRLLALELFSPKAMTFNLSSCFFGIYVFILKWHSYTADSFNLRHLSFDFLWRKISIQLFTTLFFSSSHVPPQHTHLPSHTHLYILMPKEKFLEIVLIMFSALWCFQFCSSSFLSCWSCPTKLSSFLWRTGEYLFMCITLSVNTHSTYCIPFTVLLHYLPGFVALGESHINGQFLLPIRDTMLSTVEEGC